MQLFNPLQPAPASASIPGAQILTTQSTQMTSLIPGPFILFLLLPSLPLLLFTVGARPPDTSSMPFSLMEVFTTAAFVSVAGGAVLAMVIWPDVGRGVGRWMRAGCSGGIAGPEGVKGGERVAWSWSRLLSKGGMGQSNVVGGQQISQSQSGAGGINAPAMVRAVPRTQAARAAARLYAIRSRFVHLFDPTTPHIPTALFFACLVLAVLVVVASNLLRGIYELDSPSSSSSSVSSGSSGRSSRSGDPKGGDSNGLTPWVMAEIKKRQSEQAAGKPPEKTLERFKKEAAAEREQMKAKIEKLGPEKGAEYRERKEKERGKELGVLKGQLEKLGLTIVGVEGARKGEDEKGEKEDKSTAREETVVQEQVMPIGSERSEPAWKKWKLWPDRAKEEKPKKPSVPLGERFKRAIIPVPLGSVSDTEGLSRETAKRDLQILMSGGTVPAKGKGWEVSHDPDAAAGLAHSAANAENLAARMKS